MWNRLQRLFGGSDDNKSEDICVEVDSLRGGLRCLRKANVAFTEAADMQRRGAYVLSQWATHSHNMAIEDVMLKSEQLLLLHREHQAAFVAEVEKALMLESIVDITARRVKTATRKRRKAQKKVDRLQKLFNRTPPTTATANNEKEMGQRLERAYTERDRLEDELAHELEEAQVMKMYRYRDAIQGLASANQHLSVSSAAIFDAIHHLSSHIPIICTEDVTTMRYSAHAQTSSLVQQVKETMEAMGTKGRSRQSHPPPPSPPPRKNSPGIRVAPPLLVKRLL